ncbi:cupin domain-containing protein [Tunturiibacter lichenicola]|uniref:cupin domain-containing protein n=1 Tax=Tunturiibacter lichenicola TaxID=2051959 RepID=UPI0021B294C9|nr:cupin domain-containing protein [Edaphobacter lichenicola]
MRRIALCEVFVGLVLLAAIGAARAQTPPTAPVAALTESRVFVLEQMPVRKMANGGESRDVMHGALATGEVVGVHESVQPPGATPGPLHTIQHSELITVLEGTVTFEHDGKEEKVGPGGVIYVAMGTLHRLKNVGDGPAKYCVVQIGGDTKK